MQGSADTKLLYAVDFCLLQKGPVAYTKGNLDQIPRESPSIHPVP